MPTALVASGWKVAEILQLVEKTGLKVFWQGDASCGPLCILVGDRVPKPTTEKSKTRV